MGTEAIQNVQIMLMKLQGEIAAEHAKLHETVERIRYFHPDDTGHRERQAHITTAYRLELIKKEVEAITRTLATYYALQPMKPIIIPSK